MDETQPISTCVCAMLQQHPCSFVLACSCSLEDGCLAITVLSIHTRAVDNQQLHSLCLAAVCCQVQWRRTILPHNDIVSNVL